MGTSNATIPRHVQRRAWRDIIVILLVTAAIFVLSLLFHVHERYVALVGLNDAWYIRHLDEFLLSISVLGAGFTIFSSRRLKELEAEIRDRRRVENELRAKEAQYQALTEAAQDAIFIIDRSDTITYANNYAASLLGLEPGEMIGKPRTAYFTDEISRHQLPKLLEVLKKGIPHLSENRIDYHGQEVWQDTFLVPLKDADGTVTSVLGISRDITARKRTETALRESEERHRGLVEMAPVAIVVHIDGKIAFANPAALVLVGVGDPAEIIGKPLMDFVHPDYRQLALHRVRAMLSDGTQVPPIEEVFLRSDGTPINVEVTAIPFTFQGRQAIQVVARDISERKKAEALLRESEEKYRTLFEETKDVVFINSLDGRILDINQAGVDLFGFNSKEDLTNSTRASEFYSNPLDRERLQRIMARQGYIQDFEIVLKHKDGKLITVLETATAVRDAAGTMIAIRGILRDITEQKRMEQAVQQSQKNLRNVVEQSNDAIYVLQDHKFVFVNPGFERLFDYRQGEITAPDFPFINIVAPESRAFIIERMGRRHNRESVPQRYEFRGLAKNGDVLDLEVSVSAIEWQNRPAVLGMFRDITERRKTEEELVKLRKAVNASGEVIFITDPKGIITFINPAFTQLYGYTPEEVIGKTTPRVLKSGKMKHEEYEIFWQRLVAKQVVRQEIINRTKSGRIVSTEAAVNPVLDEDGQIVGYLAIQRDITEKKRLEAESHRTQRLESIGRLAGGVAHDLNNVLAPVLLSIEVLKKQTFDETGRRILSSLQMSAERGKAIIRQILTFARGAEGEKNLLQLKHLMREMEQIVKETFPKSIELRTSIPRNLWMVTGDVTQLHQVLLNLCVNARDAMPDGGVLDLAAENLYLDEQNAGPHYDAKPGPYIAVTVSDTGIGIPPENLQKIFDPFFSTKELGSGTGLGLATVHTIVKNHNGFINVTSQVNQGSAFRVYLPASDRATASPVMKDTLKVFTGNGQLILVVDDEASIRDITRETLRMYGYDVLTAANGAEAIAIFADKKNPIDVVVTDIMMPVMDGMAAIQALRRITPGIRIIATSGLTTDVRLQEVGMNVDAFLVKPYTAEDLLKILHEVLAKTPEK